MFVINRNTLNYSDYYIVYITISMMYQCVNFKEIDINNGEGVKLYIWDENMKPYSGNTMPTPEPEADPSESGKIQFEDNLRSD